MIVDFKKLGKEQTQVGSKAYVLAMMDQAGLCVPAGMILSHLPKNDVEWEIINDWWKEQNFASLAVRSSAFGEDSEEMSFAGQNQTFLNVENLDSLKESVSKCFLSVDREASQSYRKFFTGEKSTIPMNVVLQVMVDAKYSGVYFTLNPTRSEEGAVLEYIEGFGESLVSGQVNPYQVKGSELNEKESGPLLKSKIEEVFKLGERVEKELNQKIDMEWAVDKSLKLFLLQARPITSVRSETKQDEILKSEFDRICEMSDQDTWWDGQTFAEWTGQPSILTYEVWRKAFMPDGAFDRSLHELGYLGFKKEDFKKDESILDRLYGRAFVNMSKMLPLYFGPIPYRINPTPKPHLSFDWHKISPLGIVKTPTSIWRMVKVGWNMSVHRRSWIIKSRKELTKYKHKMQRPLSGDVYKEWETEDVLNMFEKEIANFSNVALKWPLVLVVLIEATHQSLRAILKSIVGDKKTEALLQSWMGAGLSTSTYEMNRYFSRAQEEPKKREFFFSRFGHRGPGELELSHPRWQEMGDSSFGSGKISQKVKHNKVDVNKDISDLKSFKDSVVKEEWGLLKELLELREFWKMEILRPYAHIRYTALEIGKRFEIGNDIFHLLPFEVRELVESGADNTHVKKDLKKRIFKRKAELAAFKTIYLPDITLMKDFKSYLNNTELNIDAMRAQALSPGVVKGRVCIVQDPNDVDFSSWPDDAILVASATDPGWTALLTRCRGIIVERGGVLSHCAIVAREMGLPAIKLAKATQFFKDGDTVLIDGHHGRVKNDNA